MLKRAFDFLAAILGLTVLSPLLVLIGILVKITSPGPIFFRQERVGLNFRRFSIFKFRTMNSGPDTGRQITAANDPRITPVGQFLRRHKIDEIPQLFNVLRGEMSLVGPRPEVPKYVELFRSDFESLLKVRPGITDPASLKYSNEQELLAKAENPEELYIAKVLPEKIKLAKEYVENPHFLSDLRLILLSIIKTS